MVSHRRRSKGGDKMTEQEIKLEELVKQYVALEGMTSGYKQQLESIPAIENPVKVASLTEALQYSDAVAKRQARLDELHGLRYKTEKELIKVTKQLIQLIPVSNCWIRAGDYAIGCYTDAWGGNHTELAIKPWRDDLEPLKDRMNYP